MERIEVRVREGIADPAGVAALHDLRLAGLVAESVRVHQVFFVDGLRDPGRAATEVFIDPVMEERGARGRGVAVSVSKRPGVMDPAEASILRALRALGERPSRAVTAKTYWIVADATPAEILAAVGRSLANEVIEEITLGEAPPPRDLPAGASHARVPDVPLEGLSDEQLLATSRRYVLALNLAEMQAIRAHFLGLGRPPRLGELETIAQTWSEHCKHKTLTGPIDYTEGGRTERIGNLLKETIFAATRELNRDWCVSVFQDNAGVVRFDERNDVCFKVETHNHPSAIEPYGGAGTGIGGVIRDILGTGLGAKPIANTDVFCFGTVPGSWPLVGRGSETGSAGRFPEEASGFVPGSVRVMRGVVAGVRDYGNRMGIPTVNGAVCFDPRYLGNPLVYCGTVGLLPRGMHRKAARPGDRIVALGGRTGRDGIHGATFSSETLHGESDTVSGGAVQIGNAIEEKKVLDALLRARDKGLFTAVTDCGAGGFSSAVGEMGADIGAEVWLERAPLKYMGLNPVEIWISEAQERMVLSVPPEHEAELLALCAAEDVGATVIGVFTDTKRLLVKHGDDVVVDLGMEFLHDGLPRVPRRATWAEPAPLPPRPPTPPRERLLALLSDGNICSKEWIIRQYDHEVQAGSAVKPLVGPEGRGPGDAAVVVPVLGTRRGVAIGCGINPRIEDTYEMAMNVVDEAIRNVVAVGADPTRVALLDNFSWGDCNVPEVLGAMVRAARGCRDAALLFGAPFISGKDSLNNEFKSEKGTIRIPHTLLVSALGIVEDVTRCVTSDLKRAKSKLVLVGHGRPDPKVMRDVAEAIRSGRVRACHDISDGGLAVALAEMAIGGGLGGRIRFDGDLFSEAPSRFLLEVAGDVGVGTVVGEVLQEPVLDFGPFEISLAEARDAFFVWERLL
jgi:phosphoribosylformylglycinamidine synthase